jgi:Pup amidohydrolase
MLHRLLGLETEYAIRFTPVPHSPAPRNDVVFEAVRSAIDTLVLTRPGRSLSKQQFFSENGGEFSYEVLPYAPAGGLVEGATPECRGPSQALLYQKAQDHLLCLALPLAQQTLLAQGYEGSLGLIKNCRDAQGHVYGAQENYEVELASGARLFLWRAVLVALIPLILMSSLLTWALVVVVLVAMLMMFIAVGLAGLVWRGFRRGPIHRLFFAQSQAFEAGLGRVMYWLERALWEPVMAPFLLVARLVAFRRVRRDLIGFLVTRPIITGAGSLNPDGSFELCEKGQAMRCEARRTLAPSDRAIFELGNLCKDLVEPMTLRLRSFARLFRRRQRMQLGLSDSNMAQVAEYLKVAVTCLIIDMSEAGALDGLPELGDPVAALHAISADPSLETRVAIKGGEPMRAMDIQRAYLERAREFVHRDSTPSLEASEVVKRWREALDLLETEPAALFGRIDWITKKQLVQQAGGDEHEIKKKIDIKYHELGAGYFALLEKRDLAPRLVRDEEIERALREPPARSPAQIRSLIIRNLGRRDEKVRVSWSDVRIGGPLRGTVIRLDDHRDE